MPNTPKGLSDEKAARIMVGLREGYTTRKFWVGTARLEAYLVAHPEYAREARPLMEANTRAARKRKGSRLRDLTRLFCLKGLHPMTGNNVRIDPSRGRRACLACRNIARDNPPLITPIVLTKIKQALEAGASQSQICNGAPVGGGKIDRSLILTTNHKFYQQRRLDPEFNKFVLAHLVDSLSTGQQARWRRSRTRIRTAAARNEANDYQAIRAMVPAHLPDRDDIVSTIFEDLLTGALKREDVKVRVSFYVAAQNQLFSTKYRKFGDSPLVSLDEVMFEDGSTTRSDTVSRGLWD